ncbi:MAG: glycosyltransferase family 4 protein [Vicinamibacterales bacterium]|nr:glycosyltransferase family 4 protein [Vicinamibacterales bacterium]
MNILSITAGAAAMYCGSCLRDNALASELLRRGHQVTLLPVYTPTVTDEANVSRSQRVFFGGISVYLEQTLSIFRHTPWLLDRIWDAPAVIRAFTARSIQTDPRMLGALTVSTLKGESGYQRKEIDKLTGWLAGEPVPDVINLPNSLLLGLAAPIRRVLNRPIVVTLQGEDLFLESLPEPYRAEALALVRQQIDEVDLFVAVSEYYAGFMRDYLGIPAARIRTVPLGITLTDLPAGTRPRRDPFTIGYFARVAPEKGLHNLVEAYRLLRQERGLPPARLRVAGYLGHEHRGYLQDIERRLTGWGLAGEFVYEGTLDRAQKLRFLETLDVLSVPSGYHEPKGLFLLEAMGAGVPVVQPGHGAYPEMIHTAGGGMLARSEQPADIADTLQHLWEHPSLAEELARRGAAGVREHYGIGLMADRMLNVYREAAGLQAA